MTNIEKVKAQLKVCIAGKCPKDCEYIKVDNCWMGLVGALLEEKEPRVLTLEELMSSSGGGFVEIWFEGDPEEELKEEKVLIECGWCRGCYVSEDGDFSNEDYIAWQYNKRYGLRIWTGRPTDEQREAVKWDDEA